MLTEPKKWNVFTEESLQMVLKEIMLGYHKNVEVTLKSSIQRFPFHKRALANVYYWNFEYTPPPTQLKGNSENIVCVSRTQPTLFLHNFNPQRCRNLPLHLYLCKFLNLCQGVGKSVITCCFIKTWGNKINNNGYTFFHGYGVFIWVWLGEHGIFFFAYCIDEWWICTLVSG